MRFLFGWWFAIPLWIRILAALALGSAAGAFLGPNVAAVSWMGDVFNRLIRMIVAPLIFVIIASGVAAMGDARKLGSVGAKTIALYAGTTFVAVCVGLMMATWIQPGLGVDLAGATQQALPQARAAGDILLSIIPANPIQALADGDTLAVIFFAFLIGAGTIAAGEDGKPLAAALASASAVMLRIVGFIMEVAPFGVFALIAGVVGAKGPEAFLSVFPLGMCVLIGAAVQTFFVHGLLVRLVAWLPAIPFFRGVADAIIVGFSTSSSSATLPVAIRVAERNLGIKPSIASTVLPLGASIGMDGAAMYIAILTLFGAQAFGIPLAPSDYALIIGVTTIVAMGVAPVPSGSLFVLSAVLNAVGATPEQIGLLVGFILPFDRPLDMLRTVPNVTCDLAIATVVARMEGEIDVDEYKSAKDV
jgi:Na+/H+-dicarboxylate symporter